MLYHMKNIKLIIGGVVLVAVILIGVYLKGFGGDEASKNLRNQEVSSEDPANIALDFYNSWLEAVKSSSTDPYKLELASATILSDELRTRLQATDGHADTEIDPVLCQTTKPEKVRGKVVFEDENNVEVLVIAKDKELTAQSLFKLSRLNDGWYINDITCAPGEFEEPREFTFEKEGYLLKTVPPPYKSGNWHIVFENDGELGYITPLIFSPNSTCTATDGSESVCNTGDFSEATKISVKGQMTETGAEVQKLQFTN